VQCKNKHILKERIMKKTTLFILAMLICLIAEIANADFTFGTPTKLGSPINTQDSDGSPHISPDGLSFYFSSGRLGGSGVADLWVSTRETLDDNWGMPVNLGPIVNSTADDWAPSLSPNGLELFFTSKRPGGPGGFSDIWLATRATLEDDWGEPEPLGPNINTSGFDGHPSVSSDGLELYFCCWDDNVDRSGGYGTSDIWVTSRMSLSEPWVEPTNLGETVNSPAFEGEQDISVDGLCLVFSGDRPGGSGGGDLWITTRKTKEDPWGNPVNMGPDINSSGTDAMADISDDGSVLLFASDRSGKDNVFDIWQAPIIPIVDLNSDGIVNADDMCIIVDNWGTDNSLCDIGPMPWGDGVVDVQDLIVLAEHLFEEVPPVE
jgi:Tol biopolymer transport system component